MITFETDVGIERSIDEVFAYVSDPLNFPRWNSAVLAVRKTSTAAYSMERALPSGHAVNELEIVTCDPASEFAIRTRSVRRRSVTATGSPRETVAQSSGSMPKSSWVEPPPCFRSSRGTP